jgi:Uma2 family endonuclease
MSRYPTLDQDIDYPESDGKPVGETDLHIDWIFRIRELLRWRYRTQRVYVASNLLVYFEPGDPSKFVVPDAFVVLDSAPQRRRTYKLWEEGKAPDVVFEVTSRSTRREDETVKPAVYARLGVREYFLYDPSGEYLRPPLRGFRLEQGRYRHIEPDERGWLACARLDITLCLENGDLVLLDARTGQRQPTEAEAERAERIAVEQRVAELQAEIERLRAQRRAGPEKT